jgi:uncharacterized cupredoxin-like copper-binding protein
MNSALKGKLAVGALAVVLAVVLVSCGGGGGSGGDPAGTGGGSPSTAKATASGKATTGASSGASGGNHGSSSAATTKANSSNKSIETVVIEESEFELSPSTVTLSKPGTYAFKAVNKGSTEHNLRIAGEGVKSEVGEVGEAELERNLDPGESGVLRVTFRKPGTYEMYCPVIGHRLAGMKGEVVIK